MLLCKYLIIEIVGTERLPSWSIPGCLLASSRCSKRFPHLSSNIRQSNLFCEVEDEMHLPATQSLGVGGTQTFSFKFCVFNLVFVMLKQCKGPFGSCLWVSSYLAYLVVFYKADKPLPLHVTPSNFHYRSHNVLNALAAIAVALELGVDEEIGRASCRERV